MTIPKSPPLKNSFDLPVAHSNHYPEAPETMSHHDSMAVEVPVLRITGRAPLAGHLQVGGAKNSILAL
ncbi:MAG: hypothetical protein ACK559_31990, partial [bacterium]